MGFFPLVDRGMIWEVVVSGFQIKPKLSPPQISHPLLA